MLAWAGMRPLAMSGAFVFGRTPDESGADVADSVIDPIPTE